MSSDTRSPQDRAEAQGGKEAAGQPARAVFQSSLFLIYILLKYR